MSPAIETTIEIKVTIQYAGGLKLEIIMMLGKCDKQCILYYCGSVCEYEHAMGPGQLARV